MLQGASLEEDRRYLESCIHNMVGMEVNYEEDSKFSLFLCTTINLNQRLL